MSEPIPVTDDNSYEPGQNAAAIDDRTAESEATGKVPKSEVEDLKDSIGGGETLDNEAGVQTRHQKNDALKQEKEVDSLDLGDKEEASKSSVAQ